MRSLTEDLVAAAFPAVPFEGLPPALDAESAVSRGAAGLGGRFWDASNIYNHDFSSDTGFRSLNAVCAPETARTVTQRQNRVEGQCRSARTRYWECFEQEECRQVCCGGVEQEGAARRQGRSEIVQEDALQCSRRSFRVQCKEQQPPSLTWGLD